MRYAPILVNHLGILCTLLMEISIAVLDDSRNVGLGYDRIFGQMYLLQEASFLPQD